MLKSPQECLQVPGAQKRSAMSLLSFAAIYAVARETNGMERYKLTT